MPADFHEDKPLAQMNPLGSASSDLGLGGMLDRQTLDETEEEKRKKRLGLSSMAANSPAAQQLFGFGKTGAGNAFG